MKKIVVALCACLALASCGESSRDPLQKKVDEYALVKIATPDLSGITDNGKEVLRLYRWAADEADQIYWKQMMGRSDFLEGITDPIAREYAGINYGPWDRLDGKAFLEGYGDRPEGAGFYPADMTQEEFAALADPAKNSPYTLIERAEDGSLRVVPFHEAYAPEIQKICSFLQSAADLTIKPSVREYLLKKMDALRSDNYYESDLAWLDMTDSKMDLIIGPNETEDDQLLGRKASYGAFVLLKELKKTAEIDQLTAMLPELQASLPCPDAYKTFVPGTESDIYAYDALYYAGNYNAGIKVIAVNLPYDERVQAEKGTRTVLLHNIMKEKFNRIVFPIGNLLIVGDQTAHLNDEAFFWNIVFREVAHGLGVKETVNGKGTVAEALGNEALMIEEIKGNVVGLYLACKLIDEHRLWGIVTKEDALTTFIASLVRSERFGEGSALGRANIIIYNYLVETGAIDRNEAGRYVIDYAKAQSSVMALASEVLSIQATGDFEAARTLQEKYGKLSMVFKGDLRNIRLEGIPADLRFEFEKQ